MVTVTVLAAVACLVLATAPLVRATGARDAPAALVGRARRLLPSGRAEWGRAMSGELDHIDGRWERWRFAGSSLLAVVLLPPGPGRTNRLAAGGLAAVVAGCAVLTTVAFARFPGLWSSRHVATALVVLALVLAACAAIGPAAVRRAGATLWSNAAAVVVAGCWCALGVAADHAAGPSVADALLLLIGVVTVVAGIGRRARPVFTAALAGPLVFLGWTAGVLAAAGGPYDPGLVRDFPGSGTPDIATYAAGDGLGSAISLLLMVPLVTVALAGAGAAVSRRWRRSG